MNFGEISHDARTWIIRCEAHVRGKIKRLFPEVDQRASDVIRLSDSDENCRELLWFLQRYPMQVDRMDLLERGSVRHVDEQNEVDALLAHRRPPDDFELAIPARGYQLVAASLAMIKRGLLVADDVGLGKTATAICPMSHSVNLPALVVTMTHLPRQWCAELARFAPGLKVHVLTSGKPYDLLPKRRLWQESLFETPRLPDVIISNYHKLHGWADTLAGLVQYVVFDEIQELRNNDSNKYAAAMHIASKAKLRIGCSATTI